MGKQEKVCLSMASAVQTGKTLFLSFLGDGVGVGG